MENRPMSIDQVAEELGMTRNFVYKQARTGKMPGWIRVGDRWYLSRVNFEKFINGETKSAC